MPYRVPVFIVPYRFCYRSTDLAVLKPQTEDQLFISTSKKFYRVPYPVVAVKCKLDSSLITINVPLILKMPSLPLFKYRNVQGKLIYK